MLNNAVVAPTLPVTDLQIARQFYEGKLGLEPADVNETNVMYTCAEGTAFLIYQRPTPSQADHTALGFRVDNFDQVFEQLGQAGVTFEVYDLPHLQTDERGIATDDSGNRSAWFKDPGGNILAVGEF